LGATLETQRRLTRHAGDTGTAGDWLVRTPLTLFDGSIALAYPLTVGWGLLGVVVARGTQHPRVSAAAAVGLALTAGAAWWGRRRGRARLPAVAA
jgi:hypothetical protein